VRRRRSRAYSGPRAPDGGGASDTLRSTWWIRGPTKSRSRGTHSQRPPPASSRKPDRTCSSSTSSRTASRRGRRRTRANIDAFVGNYLSVPQRDDLEGIDYPHTLQPDSNTGVLPQADYDFNKDGDVDELPGDAYGFGFYPGQYASGLVSRYPFDEDDVRSFREFLWADMPGNLIPLLGENGVDESGIYLTEAETGCTGSP
jgi:hypothetical protein